MPGTPGFLHPGNGLSEGLPTPSSGLWEQAQPGWRSAADMQRAEAWRAEVNVRREGTGSPDPPHRPGRRGNLGKPCRSRGFWRKFRACRCR